MKYLFILFFFLNSFVYSFQYNLSICAIFQNEASWLKEWIDYHRKVGVEHFWLYNNNSMDNYLSILDPYIKQQIVEIVEWPSQENEPFKFFYHVQVDAYNHAINASRNVSKWLAIVDTDEFIVSKQENSIIECLEKRYFYCSGVCVNWQNFGTSHIQKLDSNKKMVEQLTLKMHWNNERNMCFKSIVQPLHVLNCPNPHYCVYRNPHWHVNTKYEKVNQTSPVDISVLQINHYWTRDQEYFYKNKLPRYLKWNGTIQGIEELASQMNEESDTSILRLLD